MKSDPPLFTYFQMSMSFLLTITEGNLLNNL